MVKNLMISFYPFHPFLKKNLKLYNSIKEVNELIDPCERYVGLEVNIKDVVHVYTFGVKDVNLLIKESLDL